MSQDGDPTASLSSYASSTWPPHGKNVFPHVKLEFPMFQLVSVNCHPMTMELHEESGFTFSLVSHYLKKAAWSPFGLLFLRLSNLFSQLLLTQESEDSTEGRLEIQADSFNHISSFKELQALFHRNHPPRTFTSVFIQGHALQKSILPLSVNVLVPPTGSHWQDSSAVTHSHTVNLQHPFVHVFAKGYLLY